MRCAVRRSPPISWKNSALRSLSGLEQAREDTGGTGGAGKRRRKSRLHGRFIPKATSYWQPTLDESEAAAKSITRNDLTSFYKTYYRPDTITLTVVGDVKTADVEQQVRAAFGDWKSPDSPKPVLDIPDVATPATPPAPIVIPLADAPQTSLLFGYDGGLKRDSPDFYSAQIMDYILGGDTFGARLGKSNPRSERAGVLGLLVYRRAARLRAI